MITQQETHILEKTVVLVRQLSSESRLRLAQNILATLLTDSFTTPGQKIWYGQFQGARMSTEADFALAEWHPRDEEWHDA